MFCNSEPVFPPAFWRLARDRPVSSIFLGETCSGSGFIQAENGGKISLFACSHDELLGFARRPLLGVSSFLSSDSSDSSDSRLGGANVSPRKMRAWRQGGDSKARDALQRVSRQRPCRRRRPNSRVRAHCEGVELLVRLQPREMTCWIRLHALVVLVRRDTGASFAHASVVRHLHRMFGCMDNIFKRAKYHKAPSGSSGYVPAHVGPRAIPRLGDA